MRRLLAVLVLCFSSMRGSCEVVVFEDSFNAPTLDSSKWDVRLPFGDSFVSQSGGKANLFARGTIVTKTSFTAPYTLTGSFVNLNNTAHSAYSVFLINLRSSGNYVGDIYGNIDGLQVTMWARASAPGGDGLYFGISNGINFLGRTWWPTTGQEHFFSISDNGASVSLDIDGVRMFDYATSASWGNKIGFASRETLGGAGGSDYTGDVDLMSVQVSVPEPSTASLFLMGGLVALARRKKA